MDLSTITVDDFKTRFFRDFPYLPVYDNAALYNIGARVYYPTTQLFYDCTVNGTTGITPDTPSNWTLVSDSTLNYIQDQDISNAFDEAMFNLNQGLFGSDEQIHLGFLYLTAHYLVNDIRAGRAGVAAQAQFPVSSKSVGSVSESYAVPARYADDPILSFYTSSSYGLKYLSLILPQMVGNVFTVEGGTNA